MPRREDNLQILMEIYQTHTSKMILLTLYLVTTVLMLFSSTVSESEAFVSNDNIFSLFLK